MQRTTTDTVPIVAVATPSLPPLYDWPVPIKAAVLSVCVMMCIVAYIAMASGLIGLATVVLGLL